jgi:hypothetical protein
LAIEQALMRSIKTTGGLTRGRGMSENQRALWILSRPDCAEMNDAMQTFTGTNYYSLDQHKEDGKSRQKRDIKDTMIFTSFLEERNPFINEENLRNIETGVSATMDVNVDNAVYSVQWKIKVYPSICSKEKTKQSLYRTNRQALTLKRNKFQSIHNFYSSHSL